MPSGSLAKASSVGAKTVNGPSPFRALTRSALVRAAARVLKLPAATAVSTMSALAAARLGGDGHHLVALARALAVVCGGEGGDGEGSDDGWSVSISLFCFLLVVVDLVDRGVCSAVSTKPSPGCGNRIQRMNFFRASPEAGQWEGDAAPLEELLSFGNR